MSSIAEEIENEKKAAAEKLVAAERLTKLLQTFPDIQKRVGRWNKIAFYSKSVNAKVTDYDMRHNCGCCSDSPLEVWPYLETEHGRVYSDPPCFQIGERDNYYQLGDRPHDNWEDHLRAAAIPESIIKRLSKHFPEPEKEAEEGLSDDDV